jgi:hypothetical protein
MLIVAALSRLPKPNVATANTMPTISAISDANAARIAART